ncbi:hypothetical protein BGZ46_002975 [Entomortierella lignicola]|nr:hypothetical protein BGZ46_002975 [Entomortierella lignicola]
MSKLSPIEIARILSGPSPIQLRSSEDILSSQDPSCSFTIFELPIILDSICENLLLEDIQSCRRVCKTWRLIFEHYRWRSIDWLWSNRNDAINNAHWIRKLKIGPTHTTLVGNQKATNLRSLSIRTVGTWKDSEYWVNYGLHSDDNENSENDEDSNQIQIVPPNETTLQLIKQNPELEGLELDCDRDMYFYFGNYRFPDYGECDDSVLNSLKQHPSLRSIRLNLWSYDANPKGLAVILKHCPAATMRQLTVKRHIDFHNTEDERWLMSSDLEVKRYWNSWPVFIALQILEFEDNMDLAEDLVLIPILQKCPNLTKLTLPWMPLIEPRRLTEVFDTIANYCTKLQILNIRKINITETLLAKLLHSLSKLREVYLNCESGSGELVFQTILQYCSSSLETVHADGTTGATSKTIARFLEECPRLKCLWIYTAFDTNGIILSDLVNTPWTSDQIENLGLHVISHDPTLDSEDVEIVIDQQEIADLIVQLSLKFKQQKNMGSSSGLRWSSPEHNMNRELGLSLMKGQMTEHRLRWLGLNWRTQEEIRDLEKEEKLRKMGFFVVNCSPKYYLFPWDEGDEKDTSNLKEGKGKGYDEEDEAVMQDVDEEYTIYKTRNRRSKGTSRKVRNI